MTLCTLRSINGHLLWRSERLEDHSGQASALFIGHLIREVSGQKNPSPYLRFCRLGRLHGHDAAKLEAFTLIFDLDGHRSIGQCGSHRDGRAFFASIPVLNSILEKLENRHGDIAVANDAREIQGARQIPQIGRHFQGDRPSRRQAELDRLAYDRTECVQRRRGTPNRISQLDQAGNISQSKRFRQNAEGSTVQSFPQEVYRVEPCDDNDEQVGLRQLELFENSQAILIGHNHIHDGEVKGLFLGECYALLRKSGVAHLMTRHLECDLQQFADFLFVVYDKYI